MCRRCWSSLFLPRSSQGNEPLALRHARGRDRVSATGSAHLRLCGCARRRLARPPAWGRSDNLPEKKCGVSCFFFSPRHGDRQLGWCSASSEDQAEGGRFDTLLLTGAPFPSSLFFLLHLWECVLLSSVQLFSFFRAHMFHSRSLLDRIP